MPTAPELKPLTAVFDPEQHGLYVEALHAAIARAEEPRPSNIALAGQYGTGKSSVLEGLKTRLNGEARWEWKAWRIKRLVIPVLLQRTGLNPVTISLSTLDASDEPEAGDEVANKIQKEIVKQLLYRLPPAKVPASKYKRQTAFSPLRAVTLAVVVALVVVGIVWATRTPARLVEKNWFLLAAGGAVFIVVFLARWQLVDKIKLGRVSAGSLSFDLSDTEASYFDEFLDELVYYFEVSKCRVVIFEDIDRFKNTRIFENLRELNLLLNNAEQLKSLTGPIRFIYAVRDSIFESDEVADASTSRVKFFDQIVPIVPFITHRTSRDLITREMATVASIGDEVIKVVAPHITDMRLVVNIRNEFAVFKAALSPGSGAKGLDGLTDEKLFAMLVYKNLYLTDFEKITSGSSNLDKIYRAWRAAANNRATEIDKEIRDIHTNLEAGTLTNERAAEAGARLAHVAEVAARVRGYAASTLRVGNTEVAPEDAGTIAFWRDVHAADGRVTVACPGGPFELTKEDTDKIMGGGAALATWDQEARSSADGQTQRLTLDRSRLGRSSLSEGLGRDDLLVPADGTDGASVILRDYALERVGTGAAMSLLTEGFIDQNYALYASKFHGIGLTVDAANFVRQVIQNDQPDVRFHFENPAKDIHEILDEAGDTFLADHRGYNITIFDELLRNEDARLEPALRSLAGGGDEALGFIDAYIAEGDAVSAFLRRLSNHWPHVFTHVVDVAGNNTENLSAWLDAALSGAAPDLDYDTSSVTASGIVRASARMPVLTNEPPGALDSERLGTVLEHLGTVFDDITPLSDALRAETVERGLYRANATNLRAALGSESASIALDRLIAHPRVFRHALAHLPNYLEAISSLEDANTVDDADQLEAVLNAIGDVPPDLLLQVLDSAIPSANVHRLADIPQHAWPSVVEAMKCDVTVENLSAYVDSHGPLQPAWNGLLNLALSVSANGDTDAGERLRAALGVLDDVDIALAHRVDLVRSINQTTPIAAADIPESCVTEIPDLLAEGLVEDTAATFERIPQDQVAARARYISGSLAVASYLPNLVLTSGDVRAAECANRDDVRRVLLQNPQLIVHLDSAGATRLAEFAHASEQAPGPEALIALAQAGAEASALAPFVAPGMDPTVIAGLLTVMPSPYPELAAQPQPSELIVPEADRPFADALKNGAYIANVRKVNGKPELRLFVTEQAAQAAG